MTHLFAQADMLKPPTPGESINSWLIYSLMVLVLLIVAAMLALVNYLMRTAIPGMMATHSAAMEKKDALHADAVQKLEAACEGRANRRSEAHARETTERDKRFLAEIRACRESREKIEDLVFGDEDVLRVLKRRDRIAERTEGHQGEKPS